MKLSIIPIVLLSLQAAAFAQSNSKCADMTKFKSPGVALEITRAVPIPAGRAQGRAALQDRCCRLIAALME